MKPLMCIPNMIVTVCMYSVTRTFKLSVFREVSGDRHMYEWQYKLLKPLFRKEDDE